MLVMRRLKQVPTRKTNWHTTGGNCLCTRNAHHLSNRRLQVPVSHLTFISQPFRWGSRALLFMVQETRDVNHDLATDINLLPPFLPSNKSRFSSVKTNCPLLPITRYSCVLVNSFKFCSNACILQHSC